MNLPAISLDRQAPTDLMLTSLLVIAPLVYLLADVLYALRGWNDETAGTVHVFGAIGYSFVVVLFASWSDGWLRAAMLFVGLVGAAGNVAYGFNTIHVSLGALDLVDASGPAMIIKPFGLFFPLSLLLAAVILYRMKTRAAAALVATSAVVWPVAHIGNIAWLAVMVNVLLVVALVPLAAQTKGRSELKTDLSDL